MPNCIPYHQWQIILVDLITECPQSHGYDSIVVAIDHLSKQAHFITTTSNIVLGKFGLVQSQAIFAGLETRWSHP